MKHPSLPESVAAQLPRPVPLHEWAPEEAGGSDPRPGTAAETADTRPGAPLSSRAAPEPPASASPGMSRRVALKVLATAATVPVAACGAPDREPGTAETSDPASVLDVTQPPSNPLATGSATDPDLLNAQTPWVMKLSEAEMTTVQALADLIIPADERSPSASAVGAHHYVDEHVSAPYPGQERDLVLIRGGLIWLNQQSEAQFQNPFDQLSVEQQRQICDPIRHLLNAGPGLQAAARFFDLFRDLVSTAFWTTDEGMADLGYQGNVASLEFAGPPAEVLRHLGLG